MRYLLPLLLATPTATPVVAHTGHLADLGGHDHWGLAIGLGVIAGAAAIGWVKGRRAEADGDRDAEPDAAEADAEGQAA